MHTLTIAELSAGLRARRFSSVELTRTLLERIERLNGGLNAFLTVTAEQALAAARRADQELQAGRGGPLTGVPHRAQGYFLHRRHPHQLRLARCSTISFRPTTPPWSRGSRKPAPYWSARRTWTSSRWAHPTKRVTTVRCAIRGIRSASPAVPRAALLLRSPHDWCPPRPAPTPAARSVSPLR